jgi:hypothetical protein
MMRLEERVRALEARTIVDRLILFFADGSTRELRAPRDLLLRLFVAAGGRGHLSPKQAMQLELIRQSVYAEEPAGGRMVEAVRVMLHASTEMQGGNLASVALQSGDLSARQGVTAGRSQRKGLNGSEGTDEGQHQADSTGGHGWM